MKKKTLLKVLPVVAAASFAFGGFSLAGCSGESVQVIEEKIEDIQITDNATEAPYKDDASENVQKQIDDLKAGKTYTSSDPLVMYNPYGTLGLSLYVYFQTEEDAKVSYNISVPDENIPDFGGDLSKEPGKEHEYTLLGLVPGYVNTVTITTESGNTKKEVSFDYNCPRSVLTEKEHVTIDSTSELTTMSLESEFTGPSKEISLGEEKSEKSLSDGLFLIMGNYELSGGIRNYAYMYDNSGVIRGKICAGFSAAGNILFDNENGFFYLPVSNDKIAKVSKLGRVDKVYPLGNLLNHHDEIFDNDGNILFLATDNSNNEDVEDCIGKVDVKTGEVSFVLDLSDLFRSYEDSCDKEAKSAYGSAGAGMDWMHINSIWLEGDDAFLSSRETSTVIKINNLLTNPSIGYLIGSENFWKGTEYEQYVLKKANEFDIQGGQHHLMYFPSEEDGVFNLTMYNNNMATCVTRPGYDWTQDGFANLSIQDSNEPSYYYNYKVNENEKTVELVDSIAVPVSGIVSSAQTVSNGNIITDSGVQGIFSEYDSEGKLIRSYTCPPISRFLYRVFKYDFKGFFFQ